MIRLWSLADMRMFRASRFMSFASNLTALEVNPILEQMRVLSDEQLSALSDMSYRPLQEKHIVPEMRDELKAMGLDASIAAFDRLALALAENPLPAIAVITLLARDLESRLRDEIASRQFWSMTSEEAGYFTEPSSGWGKSINRFNIAGEVEEAAKCLALGRYTAVVFHLMRIMEIGVQEFGDRLGVELVTEKSWHSILEAVNKKIKAKPSTTPQERSDVDGLSGASAHLSNVKIAWRNNVMHPKATYTLEEAQDVFTHVRSFMQHLAGIL